MSERDLTSFPLCVNCKHWLVDTVDLLEAVGAPAQEVGLPLIGKCKVSGDAKLKNYLSKLAYNQCDVYDEQGNALFKSKAAATE